MKNTFRALFGVSALAFLLVAAPVLAAEVDIEAENTVTGADSNNENTHDVDNDIDVDVNNDGDVDNTAGAWVDTGNNEQSRNTEGGSLESGAVDASTDWESIVNAGASLMDDGDGLEVTADFTNDTTGADSNNENDLDVDHDVDLDLDNVADVLNSLDLTADTGNNEQSRNTEAGDVETGEVAVNSMITNWANNDSGFASAAAGSTSVDFTAENHLTGADSNNENTVDVDNDYNLDIDNDADLTTEIGVLANTGNNQQTRNTQAGSLTTGDVEVSTDVENSANNGGGITGASNGGLDLTVDATNDTTGADSNNQNTVNVSNNVDVDVDNDADVDNTLTVDANTGNNEQSRNTQGGDIETGSVSIDFTVMNEVNSN